MYGNTSLYGINAILTESAYRVVPISFHAVNLKEAEKIVQRVYMERWNHYPQLHQFHSKIVEAPDKEYAAALLAFKNTTDTTSPDFGWELEIFQFNANHINEARIIAKKECLNRWKGPYYVEHQAPVIHLAPNRNS